MATDRMALNMEQVEQLHTMTTKNLRHISADITTNITENVQRLLEEIKRGGIAGTNQSRIKENCENVNKYDGY